jgi:hypothetical protein
MAVCEWRFAALPVLTTSKVAARRVTDNHHFRLALRSISTQPVSATAPNISAKLAIRRNPR